MAKISIIVPAYNESKRIGTVLQKLKETTAKIKNLNFEIIVVDDGSSDNTCELAKNTNVTIIRHPINRGAGAALVTGFERAIQNKSDFVITIDADEQHDPNEIEQILKPVLKGDADISIGSRFAKDNHEMPLFKKMGNGILNIITQTIYGYSCTDTQCGYRAFNRKAIEKMHLTIDRYGIMSEMLGEIKRNNLKLEEIPISTLYFDKSKGTTFFDGIKIAFDLILRRFFKWMNNKIY